MEKKGFAFCYRDIAPGIRGHVVETGAFKASSLNLHFVLPLKVETAAHYALLPFVLDRGCCAYPSQEALYRKLEELYSTSISYRIGRRGDYQIVTVSVDLIDNAYAFDGTDVFGETCGVLRSLLCEPLLSDGVFLAEAVSLEKKNAKDQIRAKINSKARYAVERCREIMYAGEDYGLATTGTVEEVEAITPVSLAEAYRTFMKTARVEIFYVGGLPKDRVFAEMKKIFSDDARQPMDFSWQQKALLPREEMLQVEECISAAQGKLVIGFRTDVLPGHENYEALAVFLEILSGSPTSKLFMNVREKYSLCYHCSASADAYKGFIVVRSGIENERKSEAEAAILHEIQEIQQGNISEEEWQYAMRSLTSNLRSLHDSPSGISSFFLGCSLKGDYMMPEERNARIQQVTREQVIQVARSVYPDTCYFLRGTGTGEEEL